MKALGDDSAGAAPGERAAGADRAMVIKPFRVWVRGYPESHVYYVRSRQKALAESWRNYTECRDNMPFGEFLKIARAKPEVPSERFGEAMTINGHPAHYVSHNSQYVQFVWPGEEQVLFTHPLDIDQPEARRGTPYYEPPVTDAGGAL